MPPSQTITFSAPPKIPSGREIYDWIMGQIEPELVSSSLPLLKTKYQNETPEEKEARRVRYNQAFVRYYKMYEAYIADLHARVHRYHRQAMQGLEAFDRSGEERQLDGIAAAMFKLT